MPPAESYFGPVVDVPVKDKAWSSEERYCKCETGRGSSPDTITCNYHYDVHNCAAEREKARGTDRTDGILVLADLRKNNKGQGQGQGQGQSGLSPGSMSRSFSPVRHRRSAIHVTDDDIDDYFNTEFVYDTNFIGQVTGSIVFTTHFDYNYLT